MIVQNAYHLAHIARAPKFHGGGKGRDRARPGAARQRIPCDLGLLSQNQAPDIGFIDVGSGEHLGKIGDLQQQIPGLHIAALLHRKHVDDPVERGNNVGSLQNVFRRLVRGLRIRSLRRHMLHFRLGVTFLLLLRQEVVIGLSLLQSILSFFELSGGSGALLLQAFESVEIALCRIALRASLHDLGLQRQHFFLRAAMLDGLHVGLRALELGLRMRGLAARLGIIQLQQRLTFFDVVAFLDEQAPDRRVHGRMGFEILCRLDFAIGGDHAPNGAALERGRAYRNNLLAHGGE